VLINLIKDLTSAGFIINIYKDKQYVIGLEANGKVLIDNIPIKLLNEQKLYVVLMDLAQQHMDLK